MNIAEPQWLWWLPALVGLALAAGFAGALHQRALRQVFSAYMLDQVVPRSVRIRRLVRDAAVVIGLGLGLLALAEPRFDKQLRTVQAEGTDLVILLDLSRSMDATDVDPSRLERARREISDLGRMAAGDRLGVVVFAGGAYPRLPLTEDLLAVELVVSETSTDTFTTQGSALGDAIRTGVELLQNSQDQAGQALVVLSDGETHDPEDARAAAHEALAANIPIYAMGIGVEESPIPMPDGSLLMYRSEVATTVPDLSTLSEVAQLTGGAFVQSNASDRDMTSLYTEIRRNVQAVARESQQRETWQTAYQWPLGLAMGLFLLAGWLGDGRRRLGAATAVLLALALVPVDAAAADLRTEADRLFRDGQYQTAVDLLTELSLERPDDPDVYDRLGAARYRAGDFEGAARAYDRAAELADDPSSSLFNSGNAHYRSGRLERAIERYERTLAEDPEHPGASQNREVVRREIELRRQQQTPPPQPQPQPGEGEPEEGEDSESEPAEPQPGQPQDQGEPQPRDASEEPQPGEGEESETEPSQESPDGDTMGEDAGPITEGQAHRLLDAIEEGNAAVSVRGDRGDKPW